MTGFYKNEADYEKLDIEDDGELLAALIRDGGKKWHFIFMKDLTKLNDVYVFLKSMKLRFTKI